MTAAKENLFICSHCSAQFTKWTGRCFECGQWGTVTESARGKQTTEAVGAKGAVLTVTALGDITPIEGKRMTTGSAEMDRVVGGGLVMGSLLLLSGEPGIGKSTLSLQLASRVPKTLYLSGEESIEQIKLRSDRLKLLAPTLTLVNTTNVIDIVATIRAKKPPLAIVDSIQTMRLDDIESEPGSMTQIRAATAQLLELAKETGTIIILIGHVTKDGTVAGPKTLEHLVDTVLSFEGDRHHDLRILRATKNRFGPTDEVGLFDMIQHGIVDVSNPSAALLSERGDNLPGSVVTCLMEGTRPLLVEVQALVTKTTFGYPVRKSNGFDVNRLHMLVAVLDRRAGLTALGQYDIHVNIVGGLTADEPAADLAVALAIASAYKDKTLGKDLVVFGEIGLGGEIRSVAHMDKRLKECELLGMTRVIVAKNQKIIAQKTSLKIVPVQTIQELIKQT